MDSPRPRRAADASGNANRLRNEPLLDLSHAPHNPPRKVYFGAIHVCLQLQKRFPAAG